MNLPIKNERYKTPIKNSLSNSSNNSNAKGIDLKYDDIDLSVEDLQEQLKVRIEMTEALKVDLKKKAKLIEGFEKFCADITDVLNNNKNSSKSPSYNNNIVSPGINTKNSKSPVVSAVGQRQEFEVVLLDTFSQIEFLKNENTDLKMQMKKNNKEMLHTKQENKKMSQRLVSTEKDQEHINRLLEVQATQSERIREQNKELDNLRERLVTMSKQKTQKNSPDDIYNSMSNSSIISTEVPRSPSLHSGQSHDQLNSANNNNGRNSALSSIIQNSSLNVNEAIDLDNTDNQDGSVEETHTWLDDNHTINNRNSTRYGGCVKSCYSNCQNCIRSVNRFIDDAVH